MNWRWIAAVFAGLAVLGGSAAQTAIERLKPVAPLATDEPLLFTVERGQGLAGSLAGWRPMV